MFFSKWAHLCTPRDPHATIGSPREVSCGRYMPVNRLAGCVWDLLMGCVDLFGTNQPSHFYTKYSTFNKNEATKHPNYSNSMATYEFLPDAFDIPVDILRPLDPTRALAIHLPAPLKTHHPSQIQDLTPRLPTLFSRNLGITDEHLLSAHKASIVYPHPQTRYTLEKQNLLGTHLAILDVEGNEIANWNHPFLSLGMGSGKTEIEFPGAMKLEIKKVKETKGEKLSRSHSNGHRHHRRAERYVKDGPTYFWEAEPEDPHQLALMQVGCL